jgi:hypothetical protein
MITSDESGAAIGHVLGQLDSQNGFMEDYNKDTEKEN